MAIATLGGHTSRAVDFFNSPRKYFIIGGTTPWEDETTPPNPAVTDFRLNDVVGLKKVSSQYMVVPDENGTLEYRNQKWRIVSTEFYTTLANSVSSGSSTLVLTSVSGITIGSKLRVGDEQEVTVTAVSNNTVSINPVLTSSHSSGSKVTAGAFAEGAKYVYVKCTLGNEFPLNISYRQIGLCTGVTSPADSDVLLSAGYEGKVSNDYTSLGVLEVLDNRSPITRTDTSSEELALIIEF